METEKSELLENLKNGLIELVYNMYKTIDNIELANNEYLETLELKDILRESRNIEKTNPENIEDFLKKTTELLTSINIAASRINLKINLDLGTDITSLNKKEQERAIAKIKLLFNNLNML